MTLLFRFIAVLLATLFSQTIAARADGDGDACRRLGFRDARFVVCSFDPARSDLRLFHSDGQGSAYGSFDAVTRALWRDHAFLDFAMNGGMYHRDLSPVGLFVENGVERKPLVVSEGFGNFHLLPNGVFHFGDGKAAVTEAKAFARSGATPRFATQSGPMLVIDGALHPRFLPDSDSFKIRNGVGVGRDGRVHFVVSEDRVRFYDFALLFRDELGCANALYLDGTVSSALIPVLGRHDRIFPMGPIISVVSRVPG
ncbi:phosphodiester glycosidase family protein [Rhizobiaceae bacterium BDR2-2]|uniref:Phosphodiester glycosidase family protein n=1 Tax=Ectorhizobium quercum TaxID=2965071 RepID=A0AAE3SYQ0_9HYPH|nr:phosphodiester glycosidase family protein [Ectorhizobium quercum]MCX8999775.1 phosphodiester glycosidase family protein [Ectorhizobium quercum]